MSEPLFEIKGMNIDSVRGGVRQRIVQNAGLKAEKGSIYGLVGESGSGKSITMMASVGLIAQGLEVVGGEVNFHGRTVAARDHRSLRKNLARGVSLLFQNAKGALNPFLTTRAQVERVVRRHGVHDAIEDRIAELFKMVGLSHGDLGHKYPHQISGGQAQRLAMACALATEPQLLIADEPTTALDVTTERELLRFLTRICEEHGVTIILIAHNLSLVSEYCQELAIMHAGQVVEQGALGSIFENPLHPYTRGLMSAVPDVDAPRELVPLSGSVWGGPAGMSRCRFSHRCEFSQPVCEQEVPPMYDREGRAVRCVLYAEAAE